MSKICVPQWVFGVVRPLVALLLCLATLEVKASWEDASQVVQRSTEQMVQLFSDPTLDAVENIDQLRAEMDRLLAPVVDFDAVARGVMGKFFRRTADADRQRFEQVFRHTLVKTYAKALATFQFDRFQLLPNRQSSKREDQQLVRVEVAGNGQRYELLYFMVEREGQWRLTNVVLDGINLRQVFRNQFAAAVDSEGSVVAAINNWASRVDDPEKAE